MTKTRLFLLRHGEVKNAGDRIYNGHFNVELSKEGKRQYKIVAERLKNVPVQAIYSSDLQRASEGARMISQYHSVPVTEHKELRELNYGIWEGRRVEEVLKQYKNEMTKRYSNLLNHRIKGGETLFEMRERVIRKTEKLLKKHLGETVIIVAHGGVNRLLLLWALNSSLENFYCLQQKYSALNIINYYSNGKMDVELMNHVLFN